MQQCRVPFINRAAFRMHFESELRQSEIGFLLVFRFVHSTLPALLAKWKFNPIARICTI